MNALGPIEPRGDAPPELEPWSWRSAAWGAAAGFYAGIMVTLGLAWVWSLFL